MKTLDDIDSRWIGRRSPETGPLSAARRVNDKDPGAQTLILVGEAVSNGRRTRARMEMTLEQGLDLAKSIVALNRSALKKS